MKPQDLPPAARKTDPRTSHEGETAIAAKRIPLTHRLLELIDKYPCRTAREYGAMLGVDGAWKRVSDLANQGLVYSTLLGTTCTVTGHQARLWYLTIRGLLVLAKRRASQ